MGYIGFRLSDDQEQVLRKQAEKEKTTLSELCRKRILAAGANTDILKNEFIGLSKHATDLILNLAKNVKTLTDNLAKFDTDRTQDIQLISDSLAYIADNTSFNIAVVLEILQRDILRRYSDKNAAKRLINDAYNAVNHQGG